MLIKDKWYKSKATQRYFLCISGGCDPKFRQLGHRGYLAGTSEGHGYGLNINMLVLVEDIKQ